MRILILGGTSEARQLAERLAGRAGVAATLSLAGRTAFEHRAVVLGDGRPAMLAGLDLVATGRSSSEAVYGVATGPARPVVFVFPGQGSQWIGMGRPLYAESEVFAAAIDDCARAFRPWLNWSLFRCSVR